MTEIDTGAEALRALESHCRGVLHSDYDALDRDDALWDVVQALRAIADEKDAASAAKPAPGVELRERVARIVEGYQPYDGLLPEQAADAILALLSPLGPLVTATAAQARREAIEECAKIADAEALKRLTQMQTAAGGSWDWGDPKSAEMAQGHKHLTAHGLAHAIRALAPSPQPDGEVGS